ncbi:MAG: hypothetical protein K2Q26_08840 [Bdellovibrionales bacterium]|nr:hypothetical protein [Bdellovibrionales bacterium]
MRKFSAHWALVAILITSLAFEASASLSVLETLSSGDSNWGMSAFSLTGLKGEGLQSGGTGYNMYNFVSANYRINSSSKISLRAPFIYNSASYDDFGNQTTLKEQEMLLGDFIVGYTQYNLALLPGDIEVFWEIRSYFPTSKGSQAQRKIGAIRNEFIISKTINRHFDLEYWPKFTWHIQTQAAYENENSTPDNLIMSNTKRYDLDHWATLWYKMAPGFGLGLFFGAEDNWYNASSVNDTSRQRNNRLHEHLIKAGPALRFTLNRNFNFILNVSNKVNLRGYRSEDTGKTSDLGQFRGDQTEFVLLAFLNF